MSRAHSSLRSIRISAALKTSSARRGAGTRRHRAKARLAASTAASTSALPDLWKMPTTSRVSAGLRSSKVSPVEDSTHSPSMKFLYTLVGFVLPIVAGLGKVSVAMIASSMNGEVLMLQRGLEVRQGRAGGQIVALIVQSYSSSHCVRDPSLRLKNGSVRDDAASLGP